MESSGDDSGTESYFEPVSLDPAESSAHVGEEETQSRHAEHIQEENRTDTRSPPKDQDAQDLAIPTEVDPDQITLNLPGEDVSGQDAIQEVSVDRDDPALGSLYSKIRNFEEKIKHKTPVDRICKGESLDQIVDPGDTTETIQSTDTGTDVDAVLDEQNLDSPITVAYDDTTGGAGDHHGLNDAPIEGFPSIPYMPVGVNRGEFTESLFMDVKDDATSMFEQHNDHQLQSPYTDDAGVTSNAGTKDSGYESTPTRDPITPFADEAAHSFDDNEGRKVRADKHYMEPSPPKTRANVHDDMVSRSTTQQTTESRQSDNVTADAKTPADQSHLAPNNQGRQHIEATEQPRPPPPPKSENVRNVQQSLVDSMRQLKLGSAEDRHAVTSEYVDTLQNIDTPHATNTTTTHQGDTSIGPVTLETNTSQPPTDVSGMPPARPSSFHASTTESIPGGTNPRWSSPNLSGQYPTMPQHGFPSQKWPVGPSSNVLCQFPGAVSKQIAEPSDGQPSSSGPSIPTSTAPTQQAGSTNPRWSSPNFSGQYPTMPQHGFPSQQWPVGPSGNVLGLPGAVSKQIAEPSDGQPSSSGPSVPTSTAPTQQADTHFHPGSSQIHNPWDFPMSAHGQFPRMPMPGQFPYMPYHQPHFGNFAPMPTDGHYPGSSMPMQAHRPFMPHGGYGYMGPYVPGQMQPSLTGSYPNLANPAVSSSHMPFGNMSTSLHGNWPAGIHGSHPSASNAGPPGGHHPFPQVSQQSGQVFGDQVVPRVAATTTTASPDAAVNHSEKHQPLQQQQQQSTHSLGQQGSLYQGQQKQEQKQDMSAQRGLQAKEGSAQRPHSLGNPGGDKRSGVIPTIPAGVTPPRPSNSPVVSSAARPDNKRATRPVVAGTTDAVRRSATPPSKSESNSSKDNSPRPESKPRHSTGSVASGKPTTGDKRRQSAGGQAAPSTRFPKSSSSSSLKSPRDEKMASPKTPSDAGTKNDRQEHAIFIQGLEPGISRTDISNYFEIVTGKEVLENSIVLNHEQTDAVIIVVGKADMDKARRKIHGRRLLQRLQPTLALLEPTCSVAVSTEAGLSSADHFQLELILESIGGELEGEAREATDGSCVIVTFTEPSGVDMVCKAQLKLKEEPLRISPHYSCESGEVWDHKLHPITLPDPIHRHLSLAMAKLLQSGCCADFVEQLRGKHCLVQFTNTDVTLACTLEPSTPSFITLKNKWKSDVETCVNEYLGKKVKERHVKCNVEILGDLFQYCKTGDVKRDTCCVVCDTSTATIYIAGLIADVDAVFDVIVAKDKELNNLLTRTDAKMSLNPLVIKLMVRSGIFDGFQKMDDSHVHHDFSVVNIQGQPEDISKIKLELVKTRDKFRHVTFSHRWSESCVSLLMRSSGIAERIQGHFKTMELMVEWEVTEDAVEAFAYDASLDNDHTYARIANTEEQVKHAFDAIIETRADIKYEDFGVFETAEWTTAMADITETNDQYADFIVSRSARDVRIFGWKENVESIKKAVLEFVAQNSVSEKGFLKGTIEVKFIKMHNQDFVRVTEQKLRDQKVTIQLNHDKVIIKGTKDGIDQAKLELDNVCKAIVHEDVTLNKVAVKDVYHDARKMGKIDEIERSTGCLIKLPGENETYNVEQREDATSSPDDVSDVDDDSFDVLEDTAEAKRARPKESEEPKEFKTAKRDMKVSITLGEIGKQKADAVVIATHPNLNLKRGKAGESVLAAAGQQIQDELSANHKESIEHGTMVTAKGYNANFKHVYMTALPTWSAEEGNAKEILHKFVVDCLQLATTNKLTSISICSLGCGGLHYPQHVVADKLFQAVTDFDQQVAKTTLQTVQFVIYRRDYKVIEAFKNELKIRVAGKQETHELKRGVASIEMKVDNLADQKVDVIVCTTSTSMDLTHGVCRALLDKGGNSLQTECASKYSDSMQEGEMCELSPGNLPCKALFLTVIPQYSVEDAGKYLNRVVKACLETAEARGYKSIAFPALGTGNLRYPKEVSCRVMFETMIDWGMKTPAPTNLHKLKVVLFPKDLKVIERFTSYIVEAKGRGSRKDRTLTDAIRVREEEGVYHNRATENGVSIHGTTLEVYTGDLLNYKTEAVVACVGKDCAMKGAIAQAIKRKCPRIEGECQGKAGELNKEGVIYTSGQELNFRSILLIKYADSLSDWIIRIKKCLQVANTLQLRSLAFPALGTGRAHKAFKPDAIVECMFDALEAVGHLEHLREVHVVVFKKEQQLYAPIRGALHKKLRAGVEESKDGLTQKFVKATTRLYKKAVEVIGRPEGVMTEDERKELTETRSAMTLTIYSDDTAKIAKCKEALEKSLDESYTKQRIDQYQDIIKSLTADERKVLDINVLVDYKIDDQSGIVTLYGPSQCVLEARSMLEERLRYIQKHRREQEQASSMLNIVQWNFEETTETECKLTPYAKGTNLQIEFAYQNKDKTYRFYDNRNVIYEIDFDTLKEYPVRDKDDSVRVVRKDVLKSMKTGLPKDWAVMKESENVKIVALKASDPKYKEIEKRFHHEVKNGNYKDRVKFSKLDPNKITITKIERVQNKALYSQYVTKRSQMMEQKPNLPANKPIERTLWHGTNTNAIDSIVEHGFNRSYSGNNAGEPWYGNGVYFALDASYSVRGWMTGVDKAGEGKLFLASCLTGEYCKGEKGMRVLPPVDPAKKLVLYDCSVDNKDKPYEFCIFHDTQAYPDYIITFKP